ncbi:type III secretion system protein PrgN, partial [Enterococcus faecalis]
VSSWITRNKKIETLPISFIYSLSLSASKTMDQVYSHLLKLQDDYLLHLKRYRRTIKIIDKEV